MTYLGFVITSNTSLTIGFIKLLHIFGYTNFVPLQLHLSDLSYLWIVWLLCIRFWLTACNYDDSLCDKKTLGEIQEWELKINTEKTGYCFGKNQQELTVENKGKLKESQEYSNVCDESCIEWNTIYCIQRNSLWSK